MNDIMVICVPVKPAVKRYLSNSYLLKRNFILTSTDVVGEKLMCLLTYPPKYHKIARYADSRRIDIRVNVTDNYDRKCYISSTGADEFNRFVEKLIRHDFYNFMDFNVEENGLEVNRSIYTFIDKFEFEQAEMSFDALQKAYFRHRRKMEIRANIG